MSLKPFLLIALSLSLATSAVAGQGPEKDVPFPQIYWQLGNVSALSLKRGQIVDGFLRYYVRVPEGTAASYSVEVDYCEWVPLAGAVPRETEACSPAGALPVADLREVEPGRLYEGQFYYSLEPGDLEYKKVNRLSFTLKLRQTDGGDPEQVLASEELSLIVFAGIKGFRDREKSEALPPSSALAPSAVPRRRPLAA